MAIENEDEVTVRSEAKRGRRELQTERVETEKAEPSAGLSSGVKVFALLVCLVGGCAGLSTSSQAINSAKALSSDPETRLKVQLEQAGVTMDLKAKAMVKPMLELADRWSVPLLVTQTPYALAALAMAVMALVLLIFGGSIATRTWAGRLALVACLGRIALGAVEYQMVDDMADAMKPMMTNVQSSLSPGATFAERAQAAQNAASAEKEADTAGSLFRRVGGTVSLVGTGFVALFWGVGFLALGYHARKPDDLEAPELA